MKALLACMFGTLDILETLLVHAKADDSFAVLYIKDSKKMDLPDIEAL